jgi:hypothetical protein
MGDDKAGSWVQRVRCVPDSDLKVKGVASLLLDKSN